MADEWLTPEELASELKIPLKTIYEWRSRDVGPAGTRVGKHLRFRRSEVERWLADHTGPTRTGIAAQGVIKAEARERLRVIEDPDRRPH